MPELREAWSDHHNSHSTAPNNSSNASVNKDESAVNHEIATLLLNLASRTHPLNTATTTGGGGGSGSEVKSMGLDLKTGGCGASPTTPIRTSPATSPPSGGDVAMDLSNYAKATTTNKIGGSGGGSGSGGNSGNPYSLFPMGNVPSLPSSYLLQNLLIGKMQQQLTGSDRVTTTVNTNSPSDSSKLRSPAHQSVIRTSNSSNNSSPPTTAAGSTAASRIPLLSGQIVAQLNALLFSIHGLTDKCIEAKVEGQLAAIFTRLQEIVAMVQLSKGVAAGEEVANNSNTSLTLLDDSTNSNSKKSDALKVRGQLEEYHNVLKNSGKLHAKLNGSNGSNSITQQLRVVSPYREIVESSNNSGSSSLLSRRPLPPPANSRGVGGDNAYGVSPPEKRSKLSSPPLSSLVDSSSSSSSVLHHRQHNNSLHLHHHNHHTTSSSISAVVASSSSSSPAVATSSSSRKTSKGGKGIRNRVFCGDCPGCLKNDDCGQCRYCRDKTKFGGQNRLRQKCLHRRCQMDTHRRANSNAAAAAAAAITAASPTTTTSALVTNSGVNGATIITGVVGGLDSAIYSGLDLARLAGQRTEADAEERQQKAVFPTLIGGALLSQQNGHTSSPEPEGSQNNHQSRIDRWKAKHEAMLKMAAEGRPNLGDKQITTAAAPATSPLQQHQQPTTPAAAVEEEEMTDTRSSSSPQPHDQGKLVITMSEKEDEEEEEEEDEELEEEEEELEEEESVDGGGRGTDGGMTGVVMASSTTRPEQKKEEEVDEDEVAMEEEDEGKKLDDFRQENSRLGTRSMKTALVV